MENRRTSTYCLLFFLGCGCSDLLGSVVCFVVFLGGSNISGTQKHPTGKRKHDDTKPAFSPKRASPFDPKPFRFKRSNFLLKYQQHPVWNVWCVSCTQKLPTNTPGWNVA